VTESPANTFTYQLKTTDQSPSGGVPGVMDICVYSTPLPTGQTTDASIVPWTGAINSTHGWFAWGRPGGDPTNLPLDGTTYTFGTATFGATPAQFIAVHINDEAECNAQGQASKTCFVLPGKITQGAFVKACKFNDLDADGGKTDDEPFLAGWKID